MRNEARGGFFYLVLAGMDTSISSRSTVGRPNAKPEASFKTARPMDNPKKISESVGKNEQAEVTGNPVEDTKEGFESCSHITPPFRPPSGTG